MKGYGEYKRTDEFWLPQLPAHWRFQKIKRLFRERIQKGHPDKPLLAATQNKGVVLKKNYGSKTVEATKDLHLLKLVLLGDFVISLRSFQGGIEYTHAEGIISPAYTVMIPSLNIVPGYFRYFAKIPCFLDLLKVCVTGIREGQNVDYKKLREHSISVPPREEQDQIVRYLDAKVGKLNKLIRIKQQQIALLKEKKQAIINQAVTKGLDPNAPMKDSGIAWIGEIPEGWEVRPLGSFAKIGNGSTPLRSNARYWENGTYPWLNSSYANHDRVKKSDEFVTEYAISQCHLPIVQPQNLIIGLTGQGKTRGMVSIVDIETTINQHLAFIAVESSDVLPDFLRYSISSIYNYMRMISDGNGCTKGGLTCTTIRHLKIAIPPLKTQQDLLPKIGNIVASCEKYNDVLNLNINALTEYRTRLISDVVTGKVDVRHIPISDADILPEMEADVTLEGEVDEISDDLVAQA